MGKEKSTTETPGHGALEIKGSATLLQSTLTRQPDRAPASKRKRNPSPKCDCLAAGNPTIAYNPEGQESHQWQIDRDRRNHTWRRTAKSNRCRQVWDKNIRELATMEPNVR
jgi:hypothetical protein